MTFLTRLNVCAFVCHWNSLRFSAGEIGVPLSKTRFSRLFLVPCWSLRNTNSSREVPIHQAYMRPPNPTQLLANSDQSLTKPCPSRWKQRKKKMVKSACPTLRVYFCLVLDRKISDKSYIQVILDRRFFCNILNMYDIQHVVFYQYNTMSVLPIHEVSITLEIPT